MISKYFNNIYHYQLTTYSSHLIFVVISFLLVAFIYSSSFKFSIFGEIKKSDVDCIPENGNNIVYCCYTESDSETDDTVAVYCITCYKKWNGNLACDDYDKVLSTKPPDDGDIFSKDKGYLGLLDEKKEESPITESDSENVNIPKDEDNNNFPSMTEETESSIIEDSSDVNIQKDNEEQDAKEKEENEDDDNQELKQTSKKQKEVDERLKDIEGIQS